MRLLRAMSIVLPMSAFAGWTQVATLGGAQQDVQVVDAGVVLTAGTAGANAWRVTDAGVTPLNNLVGSYVGAGYFGANCLVALTTGGSVVPSPGCGATTPLPGSGWARFRLLSAAPWAIAVQSAGSFDAMSTGPGAAAGWLQRGGNWLASGPRSLSVARIGGLDYAVMNENGNSVQFSVDGGAPFGVPAVSALRDVAVFPFPGTGAPALLGVTGTGLTLVPDYRVASTLTPTRPAGLSIRYVASGGATAMATTFTGEVLSPIPDPNRRHQAWKLRAGAPALVDARVHCLDDRWCASVTSAGVVWAYENRLPPQLDVMVPPFDAGQTIRLFADAGDGDGDPIYVSWDGGAGGQWSAVAGVEDGTQIDFTVPPGVCVPTIIDVTVTDGLPGHDRSLRIPLTIIDRGELETIASATSAPAGGGSVSFSAFIDGGCMTPTIAWSTSDGGTGTGTSFAWTPPANDCNPAGSAVTITATASWPAGVPATTSSSQVVTVVPWGTPNAPVFASPGAQNSGEQLDWLSSGAEHTCSTSTGFPGTILEWTIDAGATRVTEIDGGLRIDAPRCAASATRVTASAVRRVSGETFNRVSLPATLDVTVAADAPPLDAGTDFSISVQGDGGVLFGILKVDAGCLAERDAEVRVTVFNTGTFVIDGGFPPEDGGWTLEVPGGCSGGTYDVVAELFENGVSTGAFDQGSITLPFSPARVGDLSANRLEVVCGAGARTALTLLSAPNACAAADVTWRAIGGPPLVTMEGQGERLELQSEALDFSIVGQQVTLEFVADAGPGNLDTASRTIELSVQPFLEVTVKARPPLRREEEAVALDVTLLNTTTCAVEGISVTLPLSGGSPLLDSVLLDGRRATARLTDDGVVIDGVSVPALGSATIQLSARARLLSSLSVVPVASLNGYVVSMNGPLTTPATGCGCSQLDGSALLALILLVSARRRRA